MTGTLCPIPWNHLGIQQNGNLRQCCQMIYPPFGKYLDGDTALRFDPNTVDDARNHPSSKALRAALMNGEQHPACQLCWEEEAVGVHSVRQTMLRNFDMAPCLAATAEDGSIDVNRVPLKYLDLRLGNLCNLKCRSCGPADSSLWVEDHAELTQHDGVAHMRYYGNETYPIHKKHGTWKIDSNDFEWHNDPAFHAWLDDRIRHGLERLYFTGGEPTVNKNHLRILDRIVALGYAERVCLDYNTNMMAIPPGLLTLWGQFRHVSIGASIDAIGDLAGYVRHPSRWSAIEKNLDAIGYGQLANVSILVATTVSILNVRHFIDLTKWLAGKAYTTVGKYPGWHLLHAPELLSIQVLPDHTKAEIVREYEALYHWVAAQHGEAEGENVRRIYAGITRFMQQASKTELLPDLKHRTASLDGLRQERLDDHLPWLADILATV